MPRHRLMSLWKENLIIPPYQNAWKPDNVYQSGGTALGILGTLSRLIGAQHMNSGRGYGFKEANNKVTRRGAKEIAWGSMKLQLDYHVCQTNLCFYPWEQFKALLMVF